MQWGKVNKICLIKNKIVKNRSNIGIYFFHTIKLSIKCCKGDRQMQYSLIVQKLQEYRTKSNILQSEMAEYLDITQSEYSKIELGKTKLSYEVLSKLYKKGCDIDMLIIGVETESVLPCVEKIYVESDSNSFVSWLKLCEWAMQHWRMEDGRDAGIGNRLLKTFVNAERDLTAFEKLRVASGITQDKMVEILGVNIKKYRRLEKGIIQPDAELMAKIYEATKCKPSFFLDENNYYLSLISEECRYGEKREEQLQDLHSMQKKFEEKE